MECPLQRGDRPAGSFCRLQRMRARRHPQQRESASCLLDPFCPNFELVAINRTSTKGGVPFFSEGSSHVLIQLKKPGILHCRAQARQPASAMQSRTRSVRPPHSRRSSVLLQQQQLLQAYEPATWMTFTQVHQLSPAAMSTPSFLKPKYFRQRNVKTSSGQPN